MLGPRILNSGSGRQSSVAESENKPEREIRGLLELKDDAFEAESTKLAPYDPLRRYLHEISRFHPLGREEEHELALLYQKTGDREAAYRLITSNLKLVVKIAMIYKKVYRNLMDLIQEGNIGLLQALRRFDPARGTRLPTYAAWWIKAYIIKFLLDNARLVKIGTTNERRRILMNLNREKRELEAKGITPTTQLLAQNLGVNEAEILEVERGMAGPEVSLEDSIGGESSHLRYIDSLQAPQDGAEEKIAQSEFRELLERKFAEFEAKLAERDLLILKKRLIAEEPETLQQIADRYGISREAVRVAEKKLTARLKKYMTDSFGDVLEVEFRRHR
jgi:RNA polymerase sigma-32 factor